jgi:putative phosphoesterase
MKVGILSDTHGNVPRTVAAAQLLKQENVSAVVHCGDIGSEAVLNELASAFGLAGTPVHAVLGNVDSPELLHFPASTGVHVVAGKADLSLGGQRVAVIHGHDVMVMKDAIVSDQYAYIFTGHTHVASDKKIGSVRVINPGALHQAKPPSLAVLDTETGALKSIAIE